MSQSHEYEVSFGEIFASLPQPLAVCDPDGVVLVANKAARRFLGAETIDGVSLGISDRDTFSSMKVNPRGGAMEFYMADVPVEGAGQDSVSVSVTPLDFGGYRVTFIEDGAAKGSPSVRLLRALSEVTEHAAIFDDPLELLTLFGSCVSEVFPDYAWRLELRRQQELLGAHEFPYNLDPGRGAVDQILAGAGKPEEQELLWRASRTGFVIWSRAGESLRAGLQVETTRSRGLTDAEVEALEIFMNFFSFICQRYLASDEPNIEVLGPILEQLEAGVALCDRRRVVRSCNEAFARMVQAPTEEIAGQDVIAFFDAELHAKLRSSAAAAMSGAHPEPLTLSTGEQGRAITLRITPVGEGDPGEGDHSMGGFWVIAQPSAASLRALEEEFMRAEQLMQLGQLASGVAHELKNPLTSILNYADYLLQKYRDQFFEKRDSERLMRIIEGVERMDHFIRDLVTLAKPHNQDMPPERVDIHTVMRRAIMLCEVIVEQHGVRITESFAATRSDVLAVDGQLVQVFVNLITNAASAMPEEGGSIELMTSVSGESIVCAVIDDGAGMDKSTAERIFEPFFTTRKSTGGSGLGLPLVRALVERHGGTVELQSALGQGTTFRIILPLLPSA
ncbi:MAG: ATP-binding protein [Myxococcota bacterium]|nr:ATP-binding protein [Myxococcota bacterium]